MKVENFAAGIPVTSMPCTCFERGTRNGGGVRIGAARRRTGSSLRWLALALPLLVACDPAYLARFEVSPASPSASVPMVVAQVAGDLEMPSTEAFEDFPERRTYMRSYEPGKAVTLTAEPMEGGSMWYVEIREMPAFRRSSFGGQVEAALAEALRRDGYTLKPIR